MLKTVNSSPGVDRNSKERKAWLMVFITVIYV